MNNTSGFLDQYPGINPEHVALLGATLRAPSAHNAQPWMIKPIDGDHEYELHYFQRTNLPLDHDNKDAYLTMGAFAETLSLKAPNYHLGANISPVLTRNGEDLMIARVVLNNMNDGDPVDPLSRWVEARHTNRNKYKDAPLPSELEDTLKGLGNILVDPSQLKDTVLEASRNSWGDVRYISDLKNWFRKDPDAEDGITPPPFNITKTDMIGLKLAFWRGKFKSNFMRSIFSELDVKIFESAPQAAVVPVDEMSPPLLFDAGRKLLRSWVTITGMGYSYHPFSVAVDDRTTAPKVAAIAGAPYAAALYRIGQAIEPPRGYSNRKPLDKVIIHS